MLQESLDLITEIDELHSFLQTLSDEHWKTPTTFMQWTPWDVVSHLYFYDEISLLAINNPEKFAVKAKEVLEKVTNGISSTEQTRQDYAEQSPGQLLQNWHDAAHKLARDLGESTPKRRLPWFGPDLSVKSFISARFMEVWAHGQEIYDLMRIQRTATDRLKHIATLGVKTFGWSFINRKLDVPSEAPHVQLTAPSGEIWQWNEPNENNAITGDALDFCHVVTQVRNIADTHLRMTSTTAQQWMSIAQCFAGPVVEPPKPGERTWSLS